MRIPRGETPQRVEGDVATPVVVNDERLSNLSGQWLVSRYQLGSVRAHGALCIVYDAQDTVLQRPITVKVSPLELAEPYREALAASAGLSYPAFIAIYDVIEQDDCLFIAQEFIDGHPLTDYLIDGAPARRGVALALQLARAVAYAHQHDLAHGDLTPAAVLIDRIAVAHVNNLRLPTNWNYFTSVATSAAASGMLAEADATLDALRADERLRDVWSVSAMLWSLLTRAGSALSEPDGERLYRDDVTPETQQVIARTLDLAHVRHIASADALALALEALDESLTPGVAKRQLMTPLAVRAFREAHEWNAPTPPMAPGQRRALAFQSDALLNAPTIPGGADPIPLDTSLTRPADDALFLSAAAQPARSRSYDAFASRGNRDVRSRSVDRRTGAPYDEASRANTYTASDPYGSFMRPWVWALIGVALFAAFFLVGFLVFPQLRLF